MECIDFSNILNQFTFLAQECLGVSKNSNDLDMECVEFPPGRHVMT